MKNIRSLAISSMFLFVATMVSSCSAIAGIFKAGMYFGIFIALFILTFIVIVLLIGIIGYVFIKADESKKIISIIFKLNHHVSSYKGIIVQRKGF